MAAHVQVTNARLAELLMTLPGQQFLVRPCDTLYGNGAASMTFVSGTELNFTYWRLISRDEVGLSSFDDGQQYGLPEKIDAAARLKKSLEGRSVTKVELIEAKGDLHICFDDGALLEIFRFTGYEVWDIRFPDKSGQYSNYI